MPQAVTPFKMVFSRSIVSPAISMSGNLFTDTRTEVILGWLVNSWTERGVMPPLLPRMHWIPKADGKFHRAILMLDYGALQPADEDTEIEPHRAAFIRSTLAIWEQEYSEGGTSGDSDQQ
jgi:hypothetical protein